MFYILIFIFIAGIAWWFYAYNTLVGLKHKVEAIWSNITTLLKRRYDLIPNLVETVKGYAAHEAGTFEKVVQARSGAMNASTVADQAQAENMLAGTLKSLFALSENYPDLKANTSFLDLQTQLREVEDGIQVARQEYNDVVMKYNVYTESFPSLYVAAQYGFVKKDYFELTEEENKQVKNAPQVKF